MHIEKPWKAFERQVADLFRLRGFEARGDENNAGRQHDVILYSTDESIQPILVECKYHEPSSMKRVSAKDVSDFVSTVNRLRISGDVSSGYLVTNTGFTATARGACKDRSEAKYVMLRTFAELRRGLVNFEPYLLRLRDMYVENGLDRSYEPLFVRNRRSGASPAAIEALLEFASSPSESLLVLTGDYGTGKTTACRQLQYVLAESALSGKETRIPLFIPLKWYGHSTGAIALLQRFLQEEGLRHANVDSLLTLHTAGQLLIIFDGFDEMLRRSTSDSRRESIQDLVEICSKSSKIILTGRPGYFRDGAELGSPLRGVGITGARDRIRRLGATAKSHEDMNWVQFSVEPLKPHQILSFLTRKSPKETLALREQHATEIMTLLKGTYNLADLAQRPILLDMIAETLAHGGTASAATPAALYGAYVETWLRIDADKGTFRSLVSPEVRLAFSVALAWIFQDRNIQSIHWRDLQSLVGDYFDLDEADDVDHFGADVQTCTFLVRDDEGSFAFAHLSFQEYFCARFLVNKDEDLKGLIHSVLDESGPTLREISDTSPAVVDFVGDLIGFPISPPFWESVAEILSQNPSDLMFRAPNVVDSSLTNMLALAEGDAMLLELADVGEAFSAAYEAFHSRVRQRANGQGDTGWLHRLAGILERRRV